MDIRERLKNRVESGLREETVTVDGTSVLVRGRSDARFVREAWLIGEDEAEAGAKVLSKKLKSLYGIDGGVTGSEYKECKLMSMLAYDTKGKPLDEIFCAAMCRTDSLFYLALLAAAMRVSGLLDPASLTAGNSTASADASG